MDIKRRLRRVIEAYLALKLQEQLHRYQFPRAFRPMQHALQRWQRCDTKKPAARIRREMSLCRKFWGCQPLHYYRYDLFRADRDLSDAELLNYVPEFYFYRLYLPYYDTRQYAMLLDDKIVTEQLFRGVGIRQPRTVCTVVHNRICDRGLTSISYERVLGELTETACPTIFVKPADGRGGHGIYVFHQSDGREYRSDSNDVFSEEFLNRIGAQNNYIVQAGVEQAPELALVYPTSVNTFRIATENKSGRVRVLCAVQRIGRGGKQVDNFCQGGLALGIDVATGRTASYLISELCERCEKHPDSNFVFHDYQIPRWEEIKAFAVELAQKLPYFTYLGLDIALARDGPLAIEANLGFGLDCYQIPLGGLREVLQITDPAHYWHHRGVRV